MKKCKCGSTEFEGKMVTKANVTVTTALSDSPTHVLGRSDAQDVEYIGPFKCVKCGKWHSTVEEPVLGKTGERHCVCGNTLFDAHQKCYHSIIVDSGNIFISNQEIYEAETPYGPYTCTECSTEYDELSELGRFIEKENPISSTQADVLGEADTVKTQKFMLICCVEREIGTPYIFDTYEDAHEKMVKELMGALKSPDKYAESDDYGIHDFSAWANTRDDWDWKIICLPVENREMVQLTQNEQAK